MAQVKIPYKPRSLQAEMHQDLKRWNVLVMHRRFGKTVFAVNHMIKHALTCPLPRPRVALVAPTFTQAKRISWDYVKYYAGVIPGVTFNETELRADFPNGGRIMLLSGENPDALRGIYLDLCVFDFGVNAGTGRAAKYLQNLVGAVADGAIGPGTLGKVREFVEMEGVQGAVEEYQKRRQGYYEQLKTFETFGRGWTRRVDETTELAKTMI